MPANNLHSIAIRGFRSIRSIGGEPYVAGSPDFTLNTLRLRAINVIIGANGSGKSNFLEVFAFLQAVRAGRLRNYVGRVGGADKILHFGRRTTPELTIEVWFRLDQPSWLSGYQIGLAPTDSDGLAAEGETVLIWDRQKYEEPFDTGFVPVTRPPGEAAISLPAKPDEKPVQGTAYYSMRARELAREQLRSWRRFQFHDTSAASPIKKTCELHDNRYFRADGANLAAYLYRLLRTHPESYRQIRSTVSLVAPFFEDFQLEPLALNADALQLEWRHRGSDSYFGASALSDGTLRFMALTTLLLQPVELRPKVILIDEPELGLHPYQPVVEVGSARLR